MAGNQVLIYKLNLLRMIHKTFTYELFIWSGKILLKIEFLVECAEIPCITTLLLIYG